QVQLPLAMPVLLRSLRVVSVQTVGMAVVNALWDEAQPHAAQILQGMAAASRAYQVPIVGGHTNLRSDCSCTAPVRFRRPSCSACPAADKPARRA
ncbi:AIR synthase related protein, partial [Klebsiella pneumoniae]|uniref:AIR synthase related protein n=1 Tax=Klebsiella pneumoniae TaxID=573 RepID=UPI00210E31A8